MRSNRIGMAILLAFLLLGGWAAADLSDLWNVTNISGTNIWSVNSSGHLVPGTDTAYDIGSSSYRAQTVYANDAVFNRYKTVPVTVTTNTTITSNANQIFVGSISGNRTYVLPAPTVGQTVWLSDTAGNVNVNGNVTIDGAGSNTINGALNVTFDTTYGTVRLVGVSTSAWIANELYAP